MTPTQQRRAIVDFLGWRDISDQCHHRQTTYSLSTPEGLITVGDPLEDLNAMHEAEKVIINQLGSNVRSRWFIHMQAYTDVAGIHSNAAQRAEAFLKALDLWK